jgi:hypothetical protein
MKKFIKGVVPDLEYKKAFKKPVPIRCFQINEDFEVETMEGLMKGQPGDWLMIGIHGEMYPCAKDIFEKTYTITG